MAGDRDDLAHEQTAPATPVSPSDRTQTQVANAPAKRDDTKLTTLGRYKIERELGAGGMGIVYAAFDPDLERRVALKVLLAPDGQDAHKQRLLREARAMARLTHPNVVTVHEVQTADGRDYVAMELVEGQSLAEWLRAEKRSEVDILTAYVAAGRGLAAAHAAGMVHRDFKPHNVLRSTSGRIAVTDFGLAREAQADPMAVTVGTPPVGGTAVHTSTPSSPLAGLTMTGSVLGTPAYMAPEQWVGGSVTAATDQFAFCVALWEALAGERPFHGDTLDILKRAVELGPAHLDDSKLPPRLRPILRRGLDPSPSARWPSMDALLAEIAPASNKKPPWLAVGFAAVGLTGFAVFLATRPAELTPLAIPGCPPPAVEPPAPLPDRPVETRAIQRDVSAWRAMRAKACALEPAVREPQLGCLDRVMSRLHAVQHAVSELPKDAQATDARYLIDPALCAAPPQLELTSPKLTEALAALLREEANDGPADRAAIKALVDRVAGEPCASAMARLLAVRADDTTKEQTLVEVEQDAARCPDERVRADAAIAIAAVTLERSSFGIPNTSKLRLAAAAVERVPQRDLVAEVEVLWMQQLARTEEPEAAIKHGEAAIAGFAARGRLDPQIDIAIFIAEVSEYLDAKGDGRPARDARLAQVFRDAETSLGPTHPSTLKLARRIAMQLFRDGDAVAAQHALEKLRVERPMRRTRTIQVRVVDPQGKPVAGATVTAGVTLFGAGTSAAFPSAEGGGTMRGSLTPESGEVVFEVPQDGMVIAQLGDRRSMPVDITDKVTLTLEPTSRIEGKVALRGALPSHAAVAVADLRWPPTSRYELIAPIKPDGSFVIEGVPRAKVRLIAAVQTTLSRAVESKLLTITAPVVTGVEIAVAETHTRSVDIIVRSTVNVSSSAAQVWLRPGTSKSTTLDKFAADGSGAAIRLAKPPKDRTPAIPGLKPGDLVARMEAPDVPASACALGLPADLDEPQLDRKVRDNLAKIEVRCVPVPPTATSVILEVPPWPRLD